MAQGVREAGDIAVELIKLFQTELEHYEKLEGNRLSLEGKANYLARMIRGQLQLAFQGLVVIPLFCGYDEEAERGRLFSFDVVGGRYEEGDYITTGSGGRDAKLYLRTAHRDDMDQHAALRLAIESLMAAAEEDTATGGPDLQRGIYPNVVTVSAEGFEELSEDEVQAATREVMGS